MMDPRRQLFEQLRRLRGSKTVIVGIGNSLKGDDGVGPFVCEQLRQAGVCAEIIDAGATPENYIQPIAKNTPQNLLVIDAVDFGGCAGEMKIFDPADLRRFVLSTHALSPHLFIDIVVRETHARVYFLGIQPKEAGLGQSISPEVATSAKWLVSALIEIFPPAGHAHSQAANIS